MKTLFVTALICCASLMFAQAPVPATGNSGISNQPQSPQPNSAAMPANQRANDRIVREVRHELLLLPRYSIFDNLSYTVQGGTVTLYGQVHDPTLHDDAENAVRRIEGVDNVVNNIQILPVSPNDDRIRREVARALYNDSSLQIYMFQAEPPIHIIVNNGNVTLEGVVDREADKTIVDHDVRSLPGIFSVTNNLRVVGPQNR